MAILLFAFWLILNGRLSADVLITGALATCLGMAFALKFGGWSMRKEKLLYIGALPALMYLACLFKEILAANIAVIRLIFSGRIEPYIRSFRTPLRTRFARVMLANSITLTPGTVTMQIVGDRLTVHCLSKRMADAVMDSALEKRLCKLEAKLIGKRV